MATVAPNLLNYALVQQAGANKAALAMFLMPGFSVVFVAIVALIAGAMLATVVPVPEPETYALMFVGLALVAWRVRRRA